jgi:hypothetical protein
MTFSQIYVIAAIIFFYLIPLSIVLVRRRETGIGILLVVLFSWIGLVIHLLTTRKAVAPPVR